MNKEKRREITLPCRNYQPSEAELQEEFEMPGLGVGAMRRAFFHPVIVRTKPQER